MKTIWKIPVSSRSVLVVLFVQYFAIMLLLGMAVPIGSSSEAREVHVAWSILSDNSWVLALRNGILPSKPPLYHWLVAFVGWLGSGVTVETARLVSILGGAVLLGLTIDLGNFLSGRRRRETQQSSGLLAGIILLFSYLFLLLSANCRVDMVFATFVVGSISTGIKAVFSSRGRSAYWILSGVCAGLATLAKGPLGVALPLLVLGVQSAWLFINGLTGARDRTIIQRYLIGACTVLLLAFLVAVPWYLLAAGEGGSAFVKRQLLFENLQRITGGQRMNTKPWYYYAPAFVRSCFPWSLIWVLALISVFSSRRRVLMTKADRQARAALVMPHLWVISGLVLFSFASGKRTSYLLPLLPAVAISVSVYLQEQLRCMSLPGFKWLSERVAGLKWNAAVVCLIIWFVLEVLRVINLSDPAAAVLQASLGNYRLQITLISGLFIGALILVPKIIQLPEFYKEILGMQSALFFFIAGILFVALGMRNEIKSFSDNALRVNAVVPVESPLVVLRQEGEEYFDPLLMYLQRPVQLVVPGQWSEIPEGAWVLARAKDAANSHLSAYSSDLVLNEAIDAARSKNENELILLSPSES